MDYLRRPLLRYWISFLLLYLFYDLFVVNGASIAETNISLSQKYARGYCSMYGICGQREDGKYLNCPSSVPAVKPDKLLSAKVQSLCPTITGNICCTSDQFDVLRQQVQQAIPFVVGCPSCLRNFLNLFCELACSPNQSLFINVTSIAEVNNTATVNAITYYVTSMFSEGLFNSCKDVKFGAMNTRAIDFIGAGANNYRDWYAFIGKKASVGEAGSPYSIDFETVSTSLSIEPMNVSVYSCGDSTLGCSCGDCPSSSACSDILPPSPPKNSSCSIHLGSVKVKCIDFAMTLLYIVVAGAVIAWAILHRSITLSMLSPRMRPLLHTEEQNELQTVKKSEDGTPSSQGLEDVRSSERGFNLSFIQGYISKYYRQHGVWIAKHPGLVLAISITVTLLFCVGLVRLRVETRPEKLWVGSGSRAAKEKEYFDSHLAPFYRIEQLIIAKATTSELDNVPSIVTDENIELLFEMQKKVDALRGNYSGTMVSLQDICLKPVGEDCASQTILQYYQMNQENFDDLGASHATFCFQHYTSSEPCLSAYKAPVNPNTILGGYTGNNYSQATAFVITYPVNNAVDENGDQIGKAIAWEDSFIHLAKAELTPMAARYNFTIAYSAENSVQEELKRESTADVLTILVSYIVMFAYISVTLGDISPDILPIYVSSKVMLGLSGVLVVVLSVLGSIGLFSAFGVKSTLIIAEVIPFLVLAVGVDNMCILVHALKRQPVQLPLEHRVGNALAEVGPSITLASLSEFLAFAVGTVTPMPACRVFSMFAALAVLLDFILQVTAFVSLMTFDFRRTEDSRIDCFPCIRASASSAELEGNLQRRQKKDGILVRYMKDIHGPVLSIHIVKVAVLLLFGAFAFISIALTTRLQPGLEQQVALPRDSYLQGYFSNISEYLRVGAPVYFVVKDYNYSLEANQTNLLCSISQCDPNSLVNEITRAASSPSSSYIATPPASWIDDFLVWVSPDAFGCCRKFTNGSYCPPDDQPPCCTDEDNCGISDTCKDCTTCFLHSELIGNRPNTKQFKEKLPWFLNALPSADCSKGGHGSYTTSVDLKGYESGVITASEFRTYHTPLNKQSDYINALKAARKFASQVSDSLKMSIFPYSKFYIFFEQYLEIWRTTLISLSLALGAVFLVCLVMTCSLWISAIILLVLAMIVLDIMGIMVLLDIQLNGISVVNLVMSVGIAVEFCVHITHAFSMSEGDRTQRAKDALTTMGASVFSGITITKFVGVLVLCFAKSEIFEVYYFRMYLALVLLGFLHGLIFLPVLLSICGPPSIKPCMTSNNQHGSPTHTEHRDLRLYKIENDQSDSSL
eukprot:TRINITY_DN5121_c0_g1_i1.p1 TRINITY_DN5121_c0_g1~~TRINITY_DN5121_c0_g1_i1.p1  ORF type:complete len:1312 (-),score=235.79 TRINITY_DN5121_c0_g1_i1:193-4128(-)